MVRRPSWILLLTVASLGLAQAQEVREDALIFGFEPTATDDNIYSDDWSVSSTAREAKRDALINELLARMPGSRRDNGYGHVIEWEGQKWNIGTDPGVIEVQPPPMKLSDVVRKMTPLYEAMWAVGLKTKLPDNPKWGTGGHIHVDKKIFVDNPLLLRNLLVDIHNRAYIEGIFNDLGDHYNARTLFERGEQDAFIDVIEAIDRKAAAKGKYEYQDVLDALKPIFGSQRYRDVNLTNLWTDSPPTVEVRLFCGQSGPKDLYDEARFLGRYLKHLEAKGKPIEPHKFTQAQRDALRSPTVAEAEFRKLLGELGLEWTPYERFVRNHFPDPLKAVGAQVRVADFYEPGRGDTWGGLDNPFVMYEVRIASEGTVKVDGATIELAEIQTAEGIVRVGRVHKRYNDRFKMELFDGEGKLVEAKELGMAEFDGVASRPKDRPFLSKIRRRLSLRRTWENWTGTRAPIARADAFADQKLAEVLRWLDRPGTRHLAEAVRQGEIRVYWVDAKKLGSRGAGALGAEVFLVRENSAKSLAVELVHEATHAYGFVKTGRTASEVEAFRAEAAFAKKAGLRSLFRHEEVSKISDAELAKEIRSRWPELYGRGASAKPHRAALGRAAGAMGRGALGMGFFAGGVMLKETVQALWHGDPGRIRDAAKGLLSPSFIGGFGLFAGLEYVTTRGVAALGMRGALASVTRFSLPLYAGVAIMHAASGQKSLRAVATDATSFGVSMLAMMPVKAALRAAVYPALIAAGPVGWVGIGALEIAQVAVMLWGAEKITPYVDRALAATWQGMKAAGSWTADRASETWNAAKRGASAVRRGVVGAIRKLKFW